MRSVPQTFYKNKRWRQCQADYMSSVNHLCERCKTKGRYIPADIVHHKIHLTSGNMNDPSVANNFENLEALCQDCHNKEHFGDKEPRRFEIGSDGELIF